MSNPKNLHYSHQLHSLLCRGAWAESKPGHTPNGAPLTWDELLRKFRKHCHGHEDLATVALQTQALSLLLLRTSESTSRPSSITPIELDGAQLPSRSSIELGDEAILLPERREEATAGLALLHPATEKSPYKSSLFLTRAYYDYALSDQSHALTILSEVDYDETLPPVTPNRTLSYSTTITSSYNPSPNGTLGSATIEAALYRSGSLAGSIGTSSIIPKLDTEMGEGKVWGIIERIRGRCLEGMSHEILLDTEAALTSYDSALTLLDRLTVAKFTAPTERGKVEAFERHRELWRWAERAMRRAVIAVSTTRPLADVLRFLRIYHFYAKQWPNSFRPSQRGLIYTLHLRTLYLLPSSTSFRATTSDSNMDRAQWISESKGVAEDFRSILTTSTHFPRSGQVNLKVLDFVDLIVANWERGGYAESQEETGWIIETLWWSTRLTFHSHRVMRHLTRLLVASGNYDDARRTFRIYVQLVSKSRETHAGSPNVSSEGPVVDSPADIDDDRTFVETLVLGARMLCKFGAKDDDVSEAHRVAQLAEEIVGGANFVKDDVLSAKVQRALGIVSAALAIKEPDANTRPKHQASALSHLIKSSELDPASASTAYHLSVAQTCTRDIDAAILSARHAVELNPKEIRAWHLLGLLLTAKEDWQGAQTVLELGVESAEDEGYDTMTAHDEGATTRNESPANGILSHDYAEGSPSPNRVNGSHTPDPRSPSPKVNRDIVPTLLPPSTTHLLPSSTLLLPIPDIHQPPIAERFDQSIQIRLTQLAITELVEGTDSANLKWPSLFTFFSEKCPSGPAPESRGHSFDVPPAEHSVVAEQSLSPHNHDPSIPQLGVLIPPSPTGPTHQNRNQSQSSPVEDKPSHSNRLSERLLKGQKQIQTFGKKIAKGGRGGVNRRMSTIRSSSAPDLHAVLGSARPYQASSIHSRQRVSPIGSFYMYEDVRSYSPPPPPPPAPEPQSKRTPRERRLLSNLWLISAATFRRLGKIQQARSAIMEAEVLDQDNPDVWVQLALYHSAMGHKDSCVASLHKALVIEPDHIPATIHLAQQYLTPSRTSTAPAAASTAPPQSTVDLASGILNNLTQKSGWDVPEAWYFLAKACRLQGRIERERECLVYALRLEESRCIRVVGEAVPRCL